MALKFEPMVRKLAAARQSTSTSGLDPQLRQNSDKAAIRTTRELGRMVGVSHDTMDKVRKLNTEADEDMKQKLRTRKISIHKAYTEMKNREHEGETRFCECCGLEKPYAEFNIVSKGTSYSPICKACEAKAKQDARNAEVAASMPPVEMTGMTVRNGKLAHAPTQLRDDPTLFDHVLCKIKPHNL